MNQRELKEIKKVLNQKKEDLLKLVNKNINIKHEIGDSIDLASNSSEKEIYYQLNDNERQLLDEIIAAIQKLDNATYGQCEQCQKKISKLRLKAIPAARHCIKCQSKIEKIK